MHSDMSTLPPVRIGIASCLLGENVRFDGNHKRDAFLVEVFGRHVTWVPVCPEVEMGLGVPRETMRLERCGQEIRLVTPKTGADHTDRLRTFAAQRLTSLSQERLCGYILKKDSPSCGMERVRLYPSTGVPDRSGQQTPPRHPCHQWELKLTGFSRGKSWLGTHHFLPYTRSMYYML
jgi:uncharacterized protein YbbK (DUF523 family)